MTPDEAKDEVDRLVLPARGDMYHQRSEIGEFFRYTIQSVKLSADYCSVEMEVHVTGALRDWIWVTHAKLSDFIRYFV